MEWNNDVKLLSIFIILWSINIASSRNVAYNGIEYITCNYQEGAGILEIKCSQVCQGTSVYKGYQNAVFVLCVTTF